MGDRRIGKICIRFDTWMSFLAIGGKCIVSGKRCSHFLASADKKD